MANYATAGTQDFPISLDDSDDEGQYYNDDDDGPIDSPYQLSENWDYDRDDMQDSFQQPPQSTLLSTPSWQHSFDARQPTEQGKKRKRASSMTSNTGYEGASRSAAKNPPFPNGYSDLHIGSHSVKPSLENRITNPVPESKKARKRRRRLQRQAEEEARIKEAGLDLLNNPNAMPSGLPQNPTLLAKAGQSSSSHQPGKPTRVTRSMARSTLPQLPASVPPIPKPLKGLNFVQGSTFVSQSDHYFTRDYHEPLQSQHDIFMQDGAGSSKLGRPSWSPMSTAFDLPAPFSRSEAPSPVSVTGAPPFIPYNAVLYPSLPPPGTTSSLPPAPIPANPHREPAKAKPVQKGPSFLMAQQQSQPQPQVTLPPPPPPPPAAPPPPLPPTQTATHSLPPKPPPPLPPPIIGMTHEHDPDFRHSTFRIPPNVKAAGSGNKTPYVPKVKRTLVLTSLPKASRTQEWLTSWAKKVGQVAPVRVVIDAQNAKALVEFTGENAAERAWGSPRLGLEIYAGAPGGVVAGPKKFMKGKPREDLIRAWWYRLEPSANKGKAPHGQAQPQTSQPNPKQKDVDMEIEEGEIVEGEEESEDAHVPIAHADTGPKKESKKEKKRRLAKERLEKKAQKANTSAANHLMGIGYSNQPMSASVDPMSWFGSYTTPPGGGPIAGYDEYGYKPWESLGMHPYPPFSESSSVAPTTHAANQASANTDNGANGKPKTVVASTDGQADDLDDYEEVDMDLDMEADDDYDLGEDDDLKYPDFNNYPPPPDMRMSYESVPSRSHPPPPAVAPPPLPPPSPYPSQYMKPIPTEPRAQKAHPLPATPSSGPPTEPRNHAQQPFKPPPAGPSFAKRALLARQKELENQIEKSKRELAVLSAVTGVSSQVSSGAATPPSTALPPATPSADAQGAEDRLRKLVLASQKSKAAAAAAAASKTPATPVPTPTPTLAQPSEPKSTPESGKTSFLPPGLLDQPKTVNISSANFSLEDLAVSFITQTIETIKARPDDPSPGNVARPSPTPLSKPLGTTASATKPSAAKLSVQPKTASAPPQSQPANGTVSTIPEVVIPSGPVTLQVKLELKEKRLMQHIQETKQLIGRLGEATSKEEKDKLSRAMKLKDKIYSMEVAAIEKLATITEPSTSGSSTPINPAQQSSSSSSRLPPQRSNTSLSTYVSNSTSASSSTLSLASKQQTGWVGQFVGLQAQTLVVDLSDGEDEDDDYDGEA
ncbi:hypothetical protein BJ165DRAFT_1524381 [Panaeolus papilionaceus]|nr:hypothetical protein BJ165DRAFT_1524381 [Panaeolus papilionaceus]